MKFLIFEFCSGKTESGRQKEESSSDHFKKFLNFEFCSERQKAEAKKQKV